MAEAITIQPEELRSNAAAMRSKITAMKEALDVASNIMSGTAESFEATSADALRNKYSELKGKFDAFYSEMTKYADFLDKTAGTYESADQAITKAANDVLEA